MTIKVALITGGTSGIGFDLAKVLTECGGWKVHLLGRNEDHLAWAAKELPQATVHQADVTVYKELAAVFQTIFRENGRIDFVFANAGVIERTNFYADHTESNDDSPPPELDPTTLEIDLKGLEGIQVNAICPGIVRTNLVDNESWNSFPTHRFAPVQAVSAVVLLLLDSGGEGCQEIVDSNNTHIPSSRLYGCAVEISGSRFYFREQPEYCDQGMEEVMGATALENQIGAILNA